MRFRNLSTAAVGALALGLLAAPSATAGGSFDVTTTADGGPGSLRAAIQEANAAGGGEIELRRGATYRLSIPGADDDASAGDLDVSAPITIDGNGATVDAAGIDRAFQVLPGAKLVLDGVTVTGGVADDGGEVGNSGGGVLNSGTLVVDRSTVAGNSAVRAGGGIEATAGSRTTVQRSTLSHNATGPTPGNGGALHLTGPGEVTVDRSTVAGNTAAAEGGGLWNSAAGTMVVSRTEVTGNTASGADATNGGGGLFNDGGSLTVERSEIRGNVADGASGSGGGILNAGDLQVERTDIDGNSASRAGGGIEVIDGSSTRIERSSLTDNETGPNPGNGGGLHISGAATVTVDRTPVRGNSAANDGGGLWNSPVGTLTVTRSPVSGNSAGGEGDNVYQESPVDGGVFTLDGEVVPPGDNDL